MARTFVTPGVKAAAPVVIVTVVRPASSDAAVAVMLPGLNT